MQFFDLVLTQASRWFEQWYESFTRIDAESLDRTEWVEFLGGPLDGYRHAVDAARIYHLPPSLILPMSASQIAHFYDTLEDAAPDENKPEQSQDRPTRHALYDLVLSGDRWCYRYCYDS
ncbi:hypothetical protein Mal15_32350 [Stieleria maiorica]|uniref:Uncharacterized protein n=1 Tax=Stieleria maiorica TaxID=2795974 RepID=A0A5B9MHX1_9BACT|nr:hypothetical protein [Stieleria maiorica]QEF99175.1 hypothetical protein Mal15_32350 [Stieleria maiorica]